MAIEWAGQPRDPGALPLALTCLDEIRRRAEGKRLAVFLDYDGTLTPIVSSPEKAVLSEETRAAVERLAERCTVGVISGRDLQDVRRLVGVDRIVYAGSHGFDIASPGGETKKAHGGAELLPELDAVERELRHGLRSIEGSFVERKKFSIAVHYRNVNEQRIADIETLVDRTLDSHRGIRKTLGKMVFDLQPDIDWNKGKALLHVLGELGLDGADVLPMYLGDDVTDEDAFRVLTERGIGIYVKDASHETVARYALESPVEVKEFLEALAALLENDAV